MGCGEKCGSGGNGDGDRQIARKIDRKIRKTTENSNGDAAGVKNRSILVVMFEYLMKDIKI